MRARLLLDENRSERLVIALADVFPEIAHVRTVGVGGASDLAVWAEAARAERLLVTKDEDFITLSVHRGEPPKVIWLNIGNASNAITAALLRSQVTTIDDFARHAEATFLALGFGSDAG